jgi:hypothetical protein
MKLSTTAILEYFDHWKNSANCYEQNAYEHLLDIRLLHDTIDLLKQELKKQCDSNSGLVEMQCNNIIATVEATEQKTLRDEFAMAALNAAIITPASWSELGYKPNGDMEMMQHSAAMAYQYADAMLKARAE